MKNNFAEAYDFLVSIIGNAPYGIIALDLEGKTTMCNSLAISQLGINVSKKTIIQKLLIDHLNHIPKLQNKLIQCFDKDRKSFNLNNIHVGNYILNIKGRRIRNGLIVTTADMTEVKAAGRKIMAALLEGQENERRRLAKEIHDGVGPLMSTIKLNIESVKKDLEDVSEKTMKKIENMEDLVHHAASDIRSISHSLMPSAIKDLGLISTLENLTLKANAAELIQVNFFHTGMNNRLPFDLELGIYRITQELLNNTLKYAKADNITIQIIKHPAFITLTVEDDGIGFEKEEILKRSDPGIGLRNIKTRAELLNGTFDIDTSPGRGVIATVEIPV